MIDDVTLLPSISHVIDDVTLLPSISHVIDDVTLLPSSSHVIDDVTLLPSISHVIDDTQCREKSETETLGKLEGSGRFLRRSHVDSVSSYLQIIF